MGDALLVADIGGTNARFALADPHAASPLLVASVREFPVAAFPSLAEAAAHYLDQVGTRARRGHPDRRALLLGRRVLAVLRSRALRLAHAPARPPDCRPPSARPSRRPEASWRSSFGSENMRSSSAVRTCSTSR